MKKAQLHWSVLALSLILSSAGFGGSSPKCPGNGYDLPENNRQVLHWMRTTKNQFRDRAHVAGEVSKVYVDRNNHLHFAITIGHAGEDIEIIYNKTFGQTPELRRGDFVEACGDYITSTAESHGYPASPNGAIVHWVHRSPREDRHASGYLVICPGGRSCQTYGEDLSKADFSR